MPGSGSAKSSSSVSSGSSVCSESQFLFASGGETGTSEPRVDDPVTGSRSWQFLWNHAGDGAGFRSEALIVCLNGVLTVTGRAIGNEVDNLCGAHVVYPDIEIISHNPVLVIITFPTCLDVWIPGPITVSE